MIDRFYCRVGDTGRAYIVILEDAVGTPLNLADCSVTFSMKHKQTGVTKVDSGTCDIVSATLGKVSWTPTAPDVDTAGTYLAWFTVTKPDATTVSFPAAARPSDFNQVIVQPTFTPSS